MAQGAHNAPRMWGDRTVRPQHDVTGLGSGLAAAGKVRNSSATYGPLVENFLSSIPFPNFSAALSHGGINLLKELFLGTYDGIAGLFTQPYIGARDEGVVGAAKGFAKGIAGTGSKFLAGESLNYHSSSWGQRRVGLLLRCSNVWHGWISVERS